MCVCVAGVGEAELEDGEDGTKEEVLSKPGLKGILQRNHTGTHSIT